MSRFDRILSRLGLRRMDEMEQHILFRAQRNAYYFLIAALAVLTFYESYQTLTQHTRLNLVPCFLLVCASMIQTITQLVLRRRAVKDDDESLEPMPFRILFPVLITVAVIAAATAAIVAMAGVRL